MRFSLVPPFRTEELSTTWSFERISSFQCSFYWRGHFVLVHHRLVQTVAYICCCTSVLAFAHTRLTQASSFITMNDITIHVQNSKTEVVHQPVFVAEPYLSDFKICLFSSTASSLPQFNPRFSAQRNSCSAVNPFDSRHETNQQ